MSRSKKKSSKKTGLPPGTLIHIGEKKIDKVRIRLIDYDEEQFREREIKSIEKCFPFRDKPTVTWINIDGLHEVDVIEKIGQHFNIHPLVLEDIVHTGQRPKMEDHESYFYLVLKMLYYENNIDEIREEQLSIILGENFVLTFQERVGDVFNSVRERIRNNARIRKRKSDYLVYALMDAVVDNYFIVLEKLEEKIELIEAQVLNDPTPRTVQSIYEMKRKLIALRKMVWPLRELLISLERSESELIQDSTAIYLRDIYDHSIQVIDTIESFRDIVTGLLDTYLSTISNRMNEVMKVLTMIATIFIPLTFIAGIYGMNFEFMPELKWHWSYPIIWLLMITIVLGMIFYFRKKKWF